MPLTRARYSIFVFLVCLSARSGFSLTVSSQTFLTSSLNPCNSGQAVTLRATVYPGTATGIVTILDGSTTLGTVTLNGGAATLSVANLAAGQHILTAQYAGDAEDTPSTSSDVVEVVYASRAASTIALSSSATSSTYGQIVTLTATVSPAAAGGSVTFYDGTTILETEPLSNGQANLQTSLIPSGTQSIVAYYSGDPNNSPSASPALAQKVSTVAGFGFGAATSFGAGSFFYTIVTGDFNGDGKADLLIDDPDFSLTVLLGNGDGTFQTAAGFPEDIVSAVAVGDFNDDGKPDLLVAPGLQVLLGSGNGTFSEGQQIGGETVTSVISADFNGDGYADFAAVTNTGAISVYLGKGTGVFNPAAYSGNTTYAPTPFELVTGDFNADGKPDLAVLGGQQLEILLGNGDGTFQQTPIYSAAMAPFSASGITFFLTEGDFNGDGKPDLAIPNGNNVLVLLGNGDGTFQPAVAYGDLTNAAATAAGDFNGDGKLDLAVTSYDYTTGTGSANILLGNGDGTFQTQVGYATGLYPAGLVAADFNGDGRADLVSANESNLSILLGSPPCPLVSATLIAVDSTGGGPQTLTITAAPSCTWTASTASGWIHLSQNTASVTVTIAPNTTGADRSGSILIGNVTVSVTQAFTAQIFTDVPPTDYYFDAVNLLSEKEITSGCSVNPIEYCPTEQASRAQMAVFIVTSVYNGGPFTLNSSVPYFDDVPVGSFGFNWIQKMYELGITTGCGNHDFCPNDPVTRAQMAVFIIAARYGATEIFSVPPTPYFTDVPPGAFAYEWIQRLRYDNITAGCGPSLFCPNNPVTRGDMAIFIMRGMFNALAAPGTPEILSIAPATIPLGQTTTVTITGTSTNFDATTIVNPIPAVTIGPITIISPISLSVVLTPAADANITQPYSMYLTTSDINQQEVLPNSLTLQ